MKYIRFLLLSLLLLGVATFMGCGVGEASKEAADKTVKSFIEAWQKGDLEACQSLTTAEDDWTKLMEACNLEGKFYTAEAMELYNAAFKQINLRESNVDTEATDPEGNALEGGELCVMASVDVVNLPKAENTARETTRQDGGILRAGSQIEALITYETYLNSLLNDTENVPHWKGTVPVYVVERDGNWLIDTQEGANDAFFSALLGAQTFGEVTLADILPEPKPEPEEKPEADQPAPENSTAPQGLANQNGEAPANAEAENNTATENTAENESDGATETEPATEAENQNNEGEPAPAVAA